jgi:hypothetical protein
MRPIDVIAKSRKGKFRLPGANHNRNRNDLLATHHLLTTAKRFSSTGLKQRLQFGHG